MENRECFTKYCLHMKNGEKIVMLEEKDIDYEESIINESSKNDNKMLEIHDIDKNLAFISKSQIYFYGKSIFVDCSVYKNSKMLKCCVLLFFV